MTSIFRRLLIVGVLLQVSSSAQAQDTAYKSGLQSFLESKYGVLSNSVTNLLANGDSLWVGPFLNLTTDGGATWQVADADSLVGTANRVFSIDIEGDVLWAGMGFVDNTSGDGVQSAAGFVFSEDGGETFRYRSAQLDRPGDTTIVYGVSVLSALDIIVPQQSPPFDIDFDPVRSEVWVAGWASGLRKSADKGVTWQRVVLPTDTMDSIHPDTLYDFRVEPQRGTTGWLNHMAFSVLVDETGTVWAGTPAGVNRSLDGGSSWTRFDADAEGAGLTGSWVISVEEQDIPGRNPIWMASWNAGEAGEAGRFGITVTRDGGETFEQSLLGERIYDFAFQDGVVYAAGDNGLFISDDDGSTWTTVTYFQDFEDPEIALRPDVRVFSVTTTSEAVWAGTSDGLVRSQDGGATWRIFRVNVPVNPEEPSNRVPRVETFAYPNPFSPGSDQFVRIKYELASPMSVELKVFDFGMHRIRTMSVGMQSAGLRELTWDGLDRDGVRIANGPYFYAIEAGGETFWGKILVIE
jgi:photosystem II stability/assembly factor-like uncharacterized protein